MAYYEMLGAFSTTCWDEMVFWQMIFIEIPCSSWLINNTMHLFQYCLVANKDVIASGSADSTVRLWSHKGNAKVLK